MPHDGEHCSMIRSRNVGRIKLRSRAKAETLYGRAEASGAHRHSSFTSPYPSNFAFMSIVAFSSLEIGQPVFAACVAFSHAA